MGKSTPLPTSCSRLEMLRQVTSLAARPIRSLTTTEKRALFSIDSTQFPSASWLGNLAIAGNAQNLLTGNHPQALQVQDDFTRALQGLPQSPALPPLKQIEAKYAAMRRSGQAQGGGIAQGVITRYLTVRCPSACVSVNSASEAAPEADSSGSTRGSTSGVRQRAALHSRAAAHEAVSVVQLTMPNESHRGGILGVPGRTAGCLRIRASRWQRPQCPVLLASE